MPDIQAPGQTAGASGGGVSGLTAAQVAALIQAARHIEYKGPYTDLAAANGDASLGFPVPAGEHWNGRLADGTLLYADGGDVTWTPEPAPSTGVGNVVNQGDYVTVLAANGAQTWPVPADQYWEATVTDGTALTANPGDTAFTVTPAATGVGNVVDQGTYATIAAANAAIAAGVPAGEYWLSTLADGTELYADPGDLTWTARVTPTSDTFVTTTAAGDVTAAGDLQTIVVPAGVTSTITPAAGLPVGTKIRVTNVDANGATFNAPVVSSDSTYPVLDAGNSSTGLVHNAANDFIEYELQADGQWTPTPLANWGAVAGTGGTGTTQVLGYTHPQPTPSTSWVINHNLGFRPNVHIEDATGGDVEGEITHTDLNNTTVTFIAAQTGTAYLS